MLSNQTAVVWLNVEENIMAGKIRDETSASGFREGVSEGWSEEDRDARVSAPGNRLWRARPDPRIDGEVTVPINPDIAAK